MYENTISAGFGEDGVDIDTFYITRAGGLLDPGNSSAQVDLSTEDNSWNLIYIILALRGETTTGGTSRYLIHGS